MPRYDSLQHPFVASTAWDPGLPATTIARDVHMSRSNSNSYLVASDAGDVVVNTGTAYQGARHRERYEQLLGRPLRVAKIVLTQSHPDHVGGWAAFDEPDTETIAQRMFPEGRRDRHRLPEFLFPRTTKLMGRKIGFDDPVRRHAYRDTPEPTVTTLFDETHRFVVGDRAFVLFSSPGGETLDGVVVWLPEERIVFTGNLTGPVWGQLPNLSTIRGDRLRSARSYVRCVDHVVSLDPELLVTGHDEPIQGAGTIRRELTRLRDATQYIHDRTVEGMNAGKDLWTLMREVALPPELAVGEGRGRTRWCVRALWEEYVGWFRFESPTELYGVPARAVWPELAALAGGPDVLAARAQAHVDAGRPIEALHLIEIALAAAPDSVAARRVQLAALELLVERGKGECYDELAYLESEIADATAAVDGRSVADAMA
jgi:alkyl sulfatase BDS1-like metallo-beta-lactamase superfamily hydrolase